MGGDTKSENKVNWEMDNRRKSLLIIITTFMLVTVPHVAIYASSFEPHSSFWLGWPFSIAVEASIIICAFFTKYQTTKLWGWIGYFGFAVASGIMNVGYIQPDTFPAWTYALFPTAAISLLGFLYRQVDKLVQGTEASKRTKTDSTPNVQERSRTELPYPERNPELDGLLNVIREQSVNSPFDSENVQDWTGRKRTKAFELLKYGEQIGDVQKISKGQYMYVNGKS